MKKLEIFGRENTYTHDYEIKTAISVIDELILKIRDPQILCYSGSYDPIELFAKADPDNFMGTDSLRWLYKTEKNRTNTKTQIECMLACSTEDSKWTAERNVGYNGIYYRRITFLPEIQDKLINMYYMYRGQLEKILDEIISEESEKARQKKIRESKWKQKTVHEKVLPGRGEFGRDGYIDATYESDTGKTIRMISRDVFDVGCFSYPLRLKGSKDCLNNEIYTEDEVSLLKWLAEFGDFKGIRM